MKIAIVVSSLAGGGAERAAGMLAGTWAARGHQVRLITLSRPAQTDYPLPPNVARDILSAPTSWFGPLRIMSRLLAIRRSLTTVPPDVVVAIQANMAIEVALATCATRLRVIGCERNIPARAVRGRLWQVLRPLAYRRLTHLVTQTAGAAEELQRIAGGTPISVIPNMLTLPLTGTGAQIPPWAIVPQDAQVLLAVGRLVPAKGFDMLIARFALIADQCPALHLVILGEGPARAALAADIKRRGLGARVHMPGRAGNLAQWYERADIFTMTSRWEGMPMVLLEAMAHGLPAVVCDFAHGPRDVIRTASEGIIVPALDHSRWCDSVMALCGDPARRRRMGQAALVVRDRFHRDAVLALWDDVLATVMRD